MEMTGGRFIPRDSRKGEQNEEQGQKKNKEGHMLSNHTDHDFDLRRRASHPVKVLCDKKMISQHHPPPGPSVHLFSCSSPDRPTPWLSLHTTIATSLFPSEVLPPVSHLLHPPGLCVGDKAA